MYPHVNFVQQAPIKGEHETGKEGKKNRGYDDMLENRLCLYMTRKCVTMLDVKESCVKGAKWFLCKRGLCEKVACERTMNDSWRAEEKLCVKELCVCVRVKTAVTMK